MQSNLVGHAKCPRLARHCGPRHMVYASSSSVYGGDKSLPFRVEDRVDHPLSLYAATKKADECLSESYSSLYRIPLTGLRFFTVYGPWGRPDMAMWIFTKALYAGKPLPLFNRGEMRRDFTYIDDIVSGVIACLDGPPADDSQVKAGGSISPHALYNPSQHDDRPRRAAVRRLVPGVSRALSVRCEGHLELTHCRVPRIATDAANMGRMICHSSDFCRAKS